MLSGEPSAEVTNQSIDVFISYSSKDIKAARYICQQLEAHNFKCWLADPNREDIPAGQNWIRQLIKGLTSSKVVLLIFSKNADTSRYVQNEIGIAFRYKVDIFPIRIQEETPGEILEYYLINTQWMDAIPSPPPMDSSKLKQIIDIMHQLLDDNKSIRRPDSAPKKQIQKLPALSTWFLRPSIELKKRSGGIITPIEGALWTFLFMFLLFFIPLAISHHIVGTFLPRSLAEMFQPASGYHYYYPDLNAILFDMFLHPAAFATLVYFFLFIGADENQYLLNSSAGFISTRNVRLTRYLINLANIFTVKILPIVFAAGAFIYRRNLYIGYGMQEPLLLWASLAVALSIYAYVRLSINTCYIALLVKPLRSGEIQSDEDKIFLLEQARALAKLTIVFIYSILMFLDEIVVQWMMSDFNGTTLFDLIRVITLIFGGITILILIVKIRWIWIPKMSFQAGTIKNSFYGVNKSNWLLLTLPAILIILTIIMWLQVY
jgi:hypothetical protein